jgi:SAM-dependent methyltransferase
MPSMDEIYEKHASQYDELVLSEDYKKNLNRLLHSLFSWDDKIVIEAGIGTGRVTNLYVEKVKRIYGFDRSPHMLERLKKNLNDHLAKIELRCADNLYLPELPEKGDVFIEGWSFGHTISNNENDIERITDILVNQSLHMAKEDGIIFFIETLGSNSKIVKVPKECLSRFYSILEARYNFIRHEISTDYKFSSVEEAARITGFFFGKDFGEKVLLAKKVTVPEWTGLWVLDKRMLH